MIRSVKRRFFQRIVLLFRLKKYKFFTVFNLHAFTTWLLAARGHFNLFFGTHKQTKVQLQSHLTENH